MDAKTTAHIENLARRVTVLEETFKRMSEEAANAMISKPRILGYDTRSEWYRENSRQVDLSQARLKKARLEREAKDNEP